MCPAEPGRTGMRVLVTGASSGVGRAVAARFTADGAAVALLSRREDELARLAGELGAGVAHALPVDVSDPEAVSAAVAAAEAAMGGIDVAVNAAGVADLVTLEHLDARQWERTIGINLSGTFYVARETGLRMRAAGGGSIVNVGSDVAGMGMSALAHYTASKAGVVGLTRALAAELAPTVRVNAVCPGPIDTPMLRAEFASMEDPAAAEEQARAAVPLGRFATAEEVAEAIHFLAVDATFSTGSVLAVDGGTSAV